MTLESWLEQAKADATRRGLRDLVPLLDTLARATAQLRGAPWRVRADTPRPGGASTPTADRNNT